MATGSVLIRVFGGLGVEADGEPVSIGGSRQRRLLALLVSRLDTVATNDWLAEYLWTDDDRPEAVAPAIRTYMSRLRVALPESARHWIETESAGYRLTAPADAIDYRRFSLLRAGARDARERGDPQNALALLDEALALWRGEPFRELEDLDWARVEVEQLHLDRLEAQEERWEAALALGRHTQITGELATFTAEHGMRDRAARQYALALHRSGRTAEALRVLDAHRNTLAEQSGLDPSAELVELENAILAADPDLQVDKVGRPLRGYRLLEEIGSGAFSVVWRAIQPSVDREVAVKQIRSGLASQPDFVRRFEAEARLVARIEHPHIVPLIDFWRDPDSAYLVMRWLRGGTLERRLDDGPLSINQVMTIALQIGGALDAAHAKGVVHRDVKSANIFFDEDDNAFLGDFGIALEVAETSGPDAALSPGSPAYASPEQIRQERLGPEADIFSFGVVLFECLTGRLPFPDAATPHELIELQTTAPYPTITDLRDDVPTAIAAAIQRATSKSPADRFNSVGEFIDALGESVDHTPSRTGTPIAVGGLTGVRNPYQGLHAFDDGDEAIFFGRERLVSELVARFDEHGAASRAIVLVGPSGSGKSSVVRAGLIPALRRGATPGSAEWFVTTMVPGADPFAALEAALLRIAVNPPPSLLKQLRDGPRGLLRGVRRCLGADSERLLLVIDQLEEIFVGRSATQSDAFLDALSTAIDDPTSPLRVVATLRADYYDRPLAHPTFAPILKETAVDVTPLAPDELEKAIAGPAGALGVGFEPGLVPRIAGDVSGQHSALPLLQYTLHQLFERRALNELTMSAYDELGGLAGALASRAESIYVKASSGQRSAIRRLLGRMTDPGESSIDLRRRVPIADLAGDDDVAWALDCLGEARLISFDRDMATREPTVEVAHEALLREWPRLVIWLDEDRESLRAASAIAVAANAWDGAGRPDTDLYRGGRLENAVGLALASPERLRSLDMEFIDTSRAAADTERNAEQGRVRRLRRLVVGTAAALAMALVAGGFAVLAQQRADDEAQSARSSAADAEAQTALAVDAADRAELATLISRSAAQAADDQEVGLLLALEAHRRDPGPATEQAVLNAVGASTLTTRVSRLPTLVTEACQAAFSDAVHEFVIVNDRMLQQDLVTAEQIDRGAAPASCGRFYVDVDTNRRWMRSEDGDHMWFGPLDGAWAVEREFDDFTRGIAVETLSTGALTIASFPEDASPVVRLVDADTGQDLGEPVSGGVDLLGSKGSVDGRYVAIGFGTPNRAEGDGETVILDGRTGEVLHRVNSALPAATFAFDLAANELVAARFDGSLMTIDLDTGEIVAEVPQVATSEFWDLEIDDEGLVVVVSQGEVSWVDRRIGPTGRTVELRDVVYAELRPDGMVFTVSTGGEFLSVLDLEGNALVDQSWDVEPFVQFAFNDGLASGSRFPDLSPIVIDLETGHRRVIRPVLDGRALDIAKSYPETDGIVGADIEGLVFRTVGDEVTESVQLGEGAFTGTRYEDLWVLLEDNDGMHRVTMLNVARGELEVLYTLDEFDAVTAHPTPDGGVHVFHSDGTLRTFDASGQLLAEHDTEATDVLIITLDPGTERLAVANLSGDSWLIDTTTGATEVISDRDLISNLGFAANGTLLAITDPDGTISLWDVDRAERAGVVWNGSGANIGSPSWYDDNTGTMWVNSSGKLLGIPLEPERWLARACEIVGRDLTQDEWDRFVPGGGEVQSACG